MILTAYSVQTPLVHCLPLVLFEDMQVFPWKVGHMMKLGSLSWNHELVKLLTMFAHSVLSFLPHLLS